MTKASAVPALVTLRIPKRLESPNVTRGHHWRARHRDSQDWQQEIVVAFTAAQVSLVEWSLWESDTWYCINSSMKARAVRRKEKRHVLIERWVPSPRNFLRDADNLAFCTKPLLDAMKRLFLLYDDSRTWLEQAPTKEFVGPEGTVIRLSTCEVELESASLGRRGRG